MQKRDQHGLTIKGCELVELQGYYIGERDLKMWGLVYVGVCVAFKAIVKTFPILGGLFQVYRWALRIL